MLAAVVGVGDRRPGPPESLVNGVHRARVAWPHLHDALARSVHSLPFGNGAFFNDLRSFGFLGDSYCPG